MIVGVPRETRPGERRVALVPDVVPGLAKKGIEVRVQTGAGDEAGYPDATYEAKGARVAPTREDLLRSADVVAQVVADAEPELMRSGQTLIGLLDPWGNQERIAQLGAAGVSCLSLELIPRITRAQSMDVLSSMATIAGYKAVLLAAETSPKMFPMMMTAAGTLAPARVFVLGVGVAGLQAIATARRLGAVVEAYDVRPAVKEQVLSVGGKFVELPLETANSEDAGGYAKSQEESFYRRQRELLLKVVATTDGVITTAVIPGKPAPVLITREIVEAMPPGAVIVDLAAERGGNCELTQAGQIVKHGGVTILGPTNIASTPPHHASLMFARNVATFLLHLAKDGNLQFDMEDPITSATLLTRGGTVLKEL